MEKTGYIDPDRDRIRAHDEANQAFRTNSVWTASDEELKRYIFGGVGPMKNHDMHAAEVVRALAINHIQMSRVIERLNAQNDVLSKRIYWLTIAGTIAAASQMFLALR